MSFRDCIIQQMQQASGQGDDLASSKRQSKLERALDQYDLLVENNVKRGLSEDVAMAEAAREITEQAEFEKSAKLKLALRGMQAQRRITRDVAQYRNGSGEADPGAALMAHLERDQVSAFPSFKGRFETIRGQLHSGIEAFLQRYKPKYAGTVKPVEGLDNIARELFNESSGDASAKALADALADTMEQARLRSNAAGASIPKKDRWGMPQNHDRVLVAKAGKPGWVNYIKDLVDWNRMRDPVTGSVVPEANRLEVLGKIYDTIKTSGMVKLSPSAHGGGSALGTRLHQHRFLEFKDADSWLKYHEQFGRGTVFDVVVNHLDHSARDIAMMEIFGPNPEATRHFMMQAARKMAGDMDAMAEGSSKRLFSQEIERKINTFNTMWDNATGANALAQGDIVGHAFAGMRNILSAAYLGSSVLLAIPGDFFTATLTRRFNGLPGTKFIANYLRQLNPLNDADRRLAVRSGLVAESAVSMASSQQRMLGEVLGPEVTRRFSDIALRLGLLTPHTDAVRHAFGLEFMGDLADNMSLALEKLPERLQKTFKRYGISADDWELMRGTKAYEERGASFLRPYDIMTRQESLGTKAQELGDKFMEMILTEREFAVPTASLRARATLIGDTRGGTLAGEIMRSFAQFKNYPITVLLLHGRRGLLEATASGKARYLASFGIGMTLAGAFGWQMKQISQGKDPMDMNPATPEGRKFWAASMMAGGGLGIWGDFLFANANRYGGSLESTIAGPLVQAGSDIKKLTVGNVQNLAEGEPTKALQETVDVLSGYAPKPFYLRLAMQRLIFDQLAKEADPKAYQKFRRIERNAYKNYGQKFWWRPGETSPSRAPDLKSAVGE